MPSSLLIDNASKNDAIATTITLIYTFVSQNATRFVCTGFASALIRKHLDQALGPKHRYNVASYVTMWLLRRLQRCAPFTGLCGYQYLFSQDIEQLARRWTPQTHGYQWLGSPVSLSLRIRLITRDPVHVISPPGIMSSGRSKFETNTIVLLVLVFGVLDLSPL